MSDAGQEPKRGVTRRAVLKWTGIGVGGLVVAGAAGVAVRGGLNGAFAAGSGNPYELWHAYERLDGIERVVAAGILAANPHNTQAWRIRAADDVVEVLSDTSRLMPHNDASGREHYAGLGSAAEQMAVAAAALGLAPRVVVFPDGEAGPVVRIELGAGAASDDALAAAIPKRHTDRSGYDGSEIAASDLAALADTAAVEGATVAWVSDPAARAALGDLYVEATEAIIADPEQSTEAFSWFRNDRADIDRHRDGLTLDCQGLDGFTLFLAKVLPAQSRPEGDRFWVTSTRDIHTRTAAAYGIVRVDDVADRAAQVTGGRMLARLHLAATDAGLGFHHMNQITERMDRDAQTGSPDVFSARWGRLIGGPASTGLVSFRLGRATSSPGLSPRRAVADVREE
jgi:hypothetical protein